MYIGPSFNRDGLILHYDTANIKCFRGNTTNLSSGINKAYGKWGTNTGYSEYFLAPNGSQGVHLNISSFTDGGVNFYRSNAISVVANTQYTISAIYKADSIPSTTAMFYVRQYNNTWVQQREHGVYDSSRLISLGNDWYLAWGSFTIRTSSEFVILQGYEYKVNNIWVYDLRLEQNGNTIYDLSKNNNNGTLINGVLYDSNNCGSLVFDGIDDSIAVPINNIPIGNSPRTIVIWFKYNKYETRYTAICGYGKNGTANTFDILIGNNGFNTIVLDVYGAGGISTYFDYTNTNWNQVVAIYTGTQLQLYLNGELKSYNNFNINTLSSNLIIGDSVWSHPGMYRGNISQILFYNRALSQSEITQIYNSTKSRYL